MRKIYFKHGTMYSGKSLMLISTYHTYKHSKKKILVLKPSADTRDFGIIKSRMSTETVGCMTYRQEDKIMDVVDDAIFMTREYPDVIMIDEVQFSTEEQIKELHKLSESFPIMCYGLKTAYTGDLFPAIAKLLPLAEDVSEIKTTCAFCDRKATHNLLVRNNKPIYEGAFVNVEGENKHDKYYAVCREHFYKPPLNTIQEVN